MKCSNIRLKDGSKPTDALLTKLCNRLIKQTKLRGFLTDAVRVKGFAVHIGENSKCFIIDTERLGHNARIGTYVKSPKGYKRTHIPTWNQRVIFNNIINDVFDLFGLTASVRSGPYTVRSKTFGRVEAWSPLSWDGEATGGLPGASYNGLGQLMTHILPESEARETLNSDRREAEHRAAMRPMRLEAARRARLKRKALFAAKHVKVSVSLRSAKEFWKYDNKVISHSTFLKLYDRLNVQEKRFVKFDLVETNNAVG